MPTRIKTTNHKRGDTFTRKVVVSDADGPMDLTGMTVSAQIKTIAFVAVDTLTVSTTGAASGEVVISKSDTSAWPLTNDDEPLICDVKFVGSSTMRTETFGVNVFRQVTE